MREVLAHFADDLVQPQSLKMERHSPGSEPLDVEKVVHEARHAVGLLVDGLDVGAGGIGHPLPFEEELREPENRGEGGAKLVGYQPDEVLLHPLNLAGAGDVAENDNATVHVLMDAADGRHSQTDSDLA